jgi:hypothetical protein
MITSVTNIVMFVIRLRLLFAGLCGGTVHVHEQSRSAQACVQSHGSSPLPSGGTDIRLWLLILG